MVAAVTAPDTNDVSLFLTTLILTGNIETSVSRLYEHVPEIDREASVRTVIESLYSQLPESVAAQIQHQQNVLNGRVPTRRQQVEIPSGRKYTVLGGYKKILPFVFAFWLIVLGAGYAILHHQHSLNRTVSRFGANPVATNF
jgi:hypothetical protein